jgi:hypothetical protein
LGGSIPGDSVPIFPIDFRAGSKRSISVAEGGVRTVDPGFSRGSRKMATICERALARERKIFARIAEGDLSPLKRAHEIVRVETPI